MKKKLFLSFVCALGVLGASAQTNFEEMTLAAALEKAGQQDKLVLADCYTDWCGPCKYMAENIFPLADVGEYLNERFICIKIDMEKGEGPALAVKYGVEAYPTFLLLNADGTLRHTVVGGSPSGEEFIAKVKEGLDKDNLKAEYEAGNRDTEFLKAYIRTLLNGGEIRRAGTVAAEMVNTADGQEIYTEPYWFIFESPELTPFGSANMMFLLTYAGDFRKAVGAEKVDGRLYELFETPLEDIIRGKNRNAGPDYVDKVEGLIVAQDMQNKQMLLDYVALIRAMKSADTAGVLELAQKIFPALPEGKTAYLYYNPVLSLRTRWSPKQKKVLLALTDQLAKIATTDANTSSLARFADAINSF